MINWLLFLSPLPNLLVFLFLPFHVCPPILLTHPYFPLPFLLLWLASSSLLCLPGTEAGCQWELLQEQSHGVGAPRAVLPHHGTARSLVGLSQTIQDNCKLYCVSRRNYASFQKRDNFWTRTTLIGKEFIWWEVKQSCVKTVFMLLIWKAEMYFHFAFY